MDAVQKRNKEASLEIRGMPTMSSFHYIYLKKLFGIALIVLFCFCRV